MPSLVMDHQVIICNFFSDWKLLLEFMAMGGWYADIRRLSGDNCFLFILKAFPVYRVYTTTLLNLATHSFVFKQLSIVLSNQTALTYYLGLLIAFSHWVGCLFLFFAWRETAEKNDDDGNLELKLLGQGERWSQYVVSLYWALQTTLTVGYGDVGAQKDTVVMMIFSSLIGISSLLVGTFFTASATVWLSNLDASKRDFTRKLKVLQEFMQVRHGGVTWVCARACAVEG